MVSAFGNPKSHLWYMYGIFRIAHLFCFYSALDLSELGHSCKLSCELSARVKPTLSDVKVALIDMGMYVTVKFFSFMYKCSL